MQDSANAFIIQEANVAVTIDGEGQWIGGCVEDLTLLKEITEIPLEYPGVGYRKTKQGSEDHTFEIGNLFLVDTSAGREQPGFLPVAGRGETYTFVFVWFDEDTGCFAKRTYYGATARSQRVRVPGQTLAYRAQTMAELAGFSDEPDMSPIPQ